jgi:hypothetical protein
MGARDGRLALDPKLERSRSEDDRNVERGQRVA